MLQHAANRLQPPVSYNSEVGRYYKYKLINSRPGSGLQRGLPGVLFTGGYARSAIPVGLILTVSVTGVDVLYVSPYPSTYPGLLYPVPLRLSPSLVSFDITCASLLIYIHSPAQHYLVLDIYLYIIKGYKYLAAALTAGDIWVSYKRIPFGYSLYMVVRFTAPAAFTAVDGVKWLIVLRLLPDRYLCLYIDNLYWGYVMAYCAPGSSKSSGVSSSFLLAFVGFLSRLVVLCCLAFLTLLVNWSTSLTYFFQSFGSTPVPSLHPQYLQGLVLVTSCTPVLWHAGQGSAFRESSRIFCACLCLVIFFGCMSLYIAIASSGALAYGLISVGSNFPALLLPQTRRRVFLTNSFQFQGSIPIPALYRHAAQGLNLVTVRVFSYPHAGQLSRFA